MRFNPNQSLHKQQGVTLIIGLAMLLVLALMSTSSAEIGIHGEKAVHNTQLILKAEQSAISANQLAFETDLYVNEALAHIDTPKYDEWATYEISLNQSEVTSQAELNSQRIVLKGYSLNSNASVKQVLLEVNSQAQVNDRVERGVTQGWVRVGAN